jgi:hypothetical protein
MKKASGNISVGRANHQDSVEYLYASLKQVSTIRRAYFHSSGFTAEIEDPETANEHKYSEMAVSFIVYIVVACRHETHIGWHHQLVQQYIFQNHVLLLLLKLTITSHHVLAGLSKKFCPPRGPCIFLMPSQVNPALSNHAVNRSTATSPTSSPPLWQTTTSVRPRLLPSSLICDPRNINERVVKGAG